MSIVGIDKAIVLDFLEVPAASAGTPPAGQVRLYGNSTTGLLAAVTSTGALALPALAAVPAHSNSAGSAGSIAVLAPGLSPPSTGYFYVCLAAGVWLRVGTDGTVSASF